MFRVTATFVALFLLATSEVWGDELDRHFFGAHKPVCTEYAQPVVVVTDVTRKRASEIDDNITLAMLARLELRGCLRVLSVVSIFGNGNSSTATIHENLQRQLEALSLQSWQPLVQRGPDASMTSQRRSSEDHYRLSAIATRINTSPRPVAIVELGPPTVSARLLRERYLSPHKIKKILAVGGRRLGQEFTTGKRLGLFSSFSDMNVAKDTIAVDYLVRHHHSLLWMVNYTTGIGERMLTLDQIEGSIPALAEHAHRRARFLYRIGYPRNRIPSWDTWLTSYFVRNGASRLSCTTEHVRVMAESNTSPLRLIIDAGHGNRYPVTVCDGKRK